MAEGSPEQPVSTPLPGDRLDTMAEQHAETTTSPTGTEPSRRGFLANLPGPLKSFFGIRDDGGIIPQPVPEEGTAVATTEADSPPAPVDASVATSTAEARPVVSVETTPPSPTADPLAALVAEQAPSTPPVSEAPVEDATHVQSPEASTDSVPADVSASGTDTVPTAVDNTPVKPTEGEGSGALPVPTEVPQQLDQPLPEPVTADLPTPVPGADASSSATIVEPGVSVTPLPTVSDGEALSNIPTPPVSSAAESGSVQASVPTVVEQPAVTPVVEATPTPSEPAAPASIMSSKDLYPEADKSFTEADVNAVSQGQDTPPAPATPPQQS